MLRLGLSLGLAAMIAAGDIVSAPQPARASRGTSLGSKIFFDTNANGVHDIDEPGIPGVRLVLWSVDAEGMPVAAVEETSTDATGAYGFHAPKGDHIVMLAPDNFGIGAILERHVTSDGAALARAARLGSAFQSLSRPGDAQLANEASRTLAVEFGGQPLGFYRQDVGGSLWHDANRNGRKDAGEPPAQQARVWLFDANNLKVQETMTDASGNYAFTRVPSGTYSIQAILSAEDAALDLETTPVSNASIDDNQDDDSNAIAGSPGFGSTQMFRATPGDTGAKGSTLVRRTDGATINTTIDMGFVLRTPTSLALRNFDATRSGARINLNWMLGGGDHVVGFHIFRAAGSRASIAAVPDDAVRVTTDMIAAFGDANYSAVDSTVAPRTIYSYYLVEYDIAGRTRVQGPIVTETGNAMTFLPAISH